MKKIRKFQEKQNKEMKRNAILKWMASFSVTVIAVATVILQEQKIDPSVYFERCSAVGNTIVYQTIVSDPSKTIIEESLFLEISSSLERYDIPIVLGSSSGTFSMRYPQSEYKLAVKGSQGFGPKTLASQTVMTKMNLSAAITNYALVSQPQSDMLLYEVSTLYYDPEQILSSLKLRFGYVESTLVQDSETFPINEQLFAITQESQTFILPEIPQENYRIYLAIEGIKTDQTLVLLDEISFNTPLKIYGDMYVSDIGENYIDLYTYISEQNLSSEKVLVHLFEENELLETRTVPLAQPNHDSQFQEQMYESVVLKFENLKKATIYRLELVIKYQDDLSGKMIESVLSTLEVTTTEHYLTALDYTLDGTQVRLTLAIYDPMNVISNLSYSVYEPSIDYPIYLTSGGFEIESFDEGTTTYVAFIDKGGLPSIDINIYATKAAGEISYSYCLIYTLSV